MVSEARILIPTDLDSSKILEQARVSSETTLLEGETMGTYWKLQLQLPVFRHIYSVENTIIERLAIICQQMSHWDPESELSQFNNAPANSSVKLSSEFFFVLKKALEIAKITQGSYSPTIGNLVQANGFGPPTSEDHCAQPTDAIPENNSWKSITLDIENQSASRSASCQLDLSSIAKGFAVDCVAESLEKMGITNYLFEIGGEFFGNGCKPNGQPWWVELDPLKNSKLLPTKTLVATCGVAIATSGTSVQSARVDGKIRHHLINPHTGSSTSHNLVAVSVIAKKCVDADAWATALFILGEENGLQLAKEQGLAACFLKAKGSSITESFSPRYEALAAE